THLNSRIDESCRSHHHLRGPLRAPRLIWSRRRRHVDDVARAILPLLEAQGPVVECARQAEAVLDKRGLARTVAAEHAPDLWHRDVRLVDENQRVLGEEVHQRVRCLAALTAGQVSCVVLDPSAAPGLAHHLEVEVLELSYPLL